jgi:hypothetical protein
MFIKTERLHSRQIFRCPFFAWGRTWRSEATGKELIVVGAKGDADDLGRKEAFYAHEYYDGSPGELAFPELKHEFSHKKFHLARRVSEDGWCHAANEVICIPFEGMRGVYQVDLIGYGPTEWLPDGISGTECVERKVEDWRALAIWPNPGKMVPIVALQYGWVIRSEQFARAVLQYSFQPYGELRLYQDREKDVLDTKRGQALHVVEQIMPVEDIEWDSGPEDYSSLTLRVRRLADDGTYDPLGQIIEFHQGRHRPRHAPHHPFQPVELVGKMAFDGSLLTDNPPLPLIF